MTTMKYILLLFSLISFSLTAEEVTLSRIKLSISNHLYVWDDPSVYPEKDLDGFTYPAVVLSQIDLQPGDSLALDEMEEELRRAKLRLEQKGWFYEVQTRLTPSRETDGLYSISIILQEGFRQRYNAGPFWGGFGIDNLGGRGDSLFLMAGWNRNGARWSRHFQPGSPLSLESELLYSAAIQEEQPYRSLSLKEGLQWQYSPDSILTLSLEKGLALEDTPLYSNGHWQGMVGFGVDNYLDKSVLLRQKLDLEFFGTMDEEWAAGAAMDAEQVLQWRSVRWKYSGALRYSYQDRPALLQTTLKENYLRSGYQDGEGRSDNFISLNTDLALAMEGRNMSFYPFISMDHCWLDYEEHKESLGLGLHIFFDSPVFLDFRIHYGMDLEGKGLFQINTYWGKPY